MVSAMQRALIWVPRALQVQVYKPRMGERPPALRVTLLFLSQPAVQSCARSQPQPPQPGAVRLPGSSLSPSREQQAAHGHGHTRAEDNSAPTKPAVLLEVLCGDQLEPRQPGTELGL